MASPEPSKYLTLISGDGFEFVVLREAAMVSTVIRAQVNPTSNFQEALTGVCRFEELSGQVLEKVVDYFHYHYRYRDATDVPDMDIPIEMCLELLDAADYLGLTPTQ